MTTELQEAPAVGVIETTVEEIEVPDILRVEGRKPTKDEMRAGLEFSLSGGEEVGRL